MSRIPLMETIELQVHGNIVVLLLNRPSVRNAINGQMREDLRTAVDYVASHPKLRGLVLTGAGSAFCAGGDIRGMQERLDQGPRAGEIGWRRQRELHETLGKLYELDRPTVAAVNGPAQGLGLDLALSCDFVWAADSAVVSASFVKRGLVPDGGGMFHLPRRVGVARAKNMIFSGRSVAAEEAAMIGLVDRVLPVEELLPAALTFLTDLGQHPPMAQALAKGVLNRSLELSLDEVNTLGSQAQAFCYSSPDHQDSVRAFLAARTAARQAR